MHNHNNRDGGYNGMIWMMLPCLLLLAFLILREGKFSAYSNLGFLAVGLLIVGCAWLMTKKHGADKKRSDGNMDNQLDDNSKKETGAHDEHIHH